MNFGDSVCSKVYRAMPLFVTDICESTGNFLVNNIFICRNVVTVTYV